MERALIVSHHELASMLPSKVKFNRRDGIESKGGLVSRAREVQNHLLEF